MIYYVGTFQPVWQVVESVHSDRNEALATAVALSSYEQQEAVTLVSDLRGALGNCTKFSNGTGVDPDNYSHVQKLAEPSLGDEAISYRMSYDIAADPDIDIDTAFSIVVSYLVVRTGTTVTTFTSELMGSDNQPTEIPQEVIDAQLKKLA